MSVPELRSLHPSLIEDPSLVAAGERILAWTRLNMPLLRGLRETFVCERPLDGRRIGMCPHVEVPSAVDTAVAREALAILSTVEAD